MLAEQDVSAAMVGVGSAAILAAGVSSDALVDNLCTQLGYPFDLVVPGGFQACSTALLCVPGIVLALCTVFSECSVSKADSREGPHGGTP